MLGTFLVHRSRRDLLRLVLRPPALLVRLLDVLVLALALVAPCFLRHQATSCRESSIARRCNRAATSAAGHRLTVTEAHCVRSGPRSQTVTQRSPTLDVLTL